MYWSSADSIGLFRLKGKSRKTFDIIISTKCVFFLNFGLGILRGFGAAARQPLPLLCSPLSEWMPLRCHYSLKY
jgi:hypothetical protein